ncbi:lipopolysaccharide biosynthesis protein, partial [Nocardioides massiliensis]
PAETVGLAGAVVAASDTLALVAQLGLNIALVRTMPRSRHQFADFRVAVLVVGGAAAAFAAGYVLLLPLTSPRVHEVIGSPWAAVLFIGLVTATAVNLLTDSVFLAIDRVRSYLWLNGVLLGLAKCGLPFLLAGAGVLGLYGSAGGAALLCGLASIVVISRHLPRSRRMRPSRELRAARGFAGAGYVTVVLALSPQLVLPLLVVNELGSAATAYFFVSIQIVALQNAIVVAVGNAMYAECERHPDRRSQAFRRGGILMGVVCVGSAAAVWVVAPLLLRVFGPEYAAEGTATLRVLSVAVIGLGLSYWGAMRLRVVGRPGAMVGAQVVGTAAVLSLAVAAVPHGTTWVGAALGVGYLVGGLVSCAMSRSLPAGPQVSGELAVSVEPAVSGERGRDL